MKYHKTTLPNGVRVIVVPTHDNPSATVMVAAEAGSNYESKTENGLSHFLEHMLFKGTPTRPSALTVSTELDAIGAESNAYTSNELVAYYAKSEKRHWKKLLEVVSDIYLNPSFPAADIEKERGVILQEIAMYEDLPKRHVWEVLAKLLYGNTPAGRSIAGPKENVKRFSREDFLKYHTKHHTAESTIIVISGDVKAKQVVDEVKRIFKEISKNKKPTKEKVKEKQTSPALSVEKKKSDQTHMLLGLRSYGAQDKRSIPVSLLMGVLGDGSSSRLYQRLREQMGACYYIYTNNDVYTDHGRAIVATGIDKVRIVEVTQAILDECKRLTYEKVTGKELQKTKDYMVSHMYMGLETTDALAGFYLSEEVVHGAARNPEELEKEIRGMTSEDLLKAAKELFKDENLNLAVVGDIKDQKLVKKVLTFK